jgi:hypothetical protein
VGETPRTFDLVKNGGRWKVDDVSYLVAVRAEIIAQTPASS